MTHWQLIVLTALLVLALPQRLLAVEVAANSEIVVDGGLVATLGGAWAPGAEATLLSGEGPSAANLPEPGTWLLFGLAFGYLALRRSPAPQRLGTGPGCRDSPR